MLALAVTLILLAAGYHAVTTLADLHPLNNVRDTTGRERRTEVAINAPLLTLPALLLGLGALAGLPALGYAAGALELLSVANGLLLWWLPYLAGASVPWATAGTGSTWPELHARTYARTIIVLPRIGDRPRPNLEHMILHALMLAGAITALLAASGL